MPFCANYTFLVWRSLIFFSWFVYYPGRLCFSTTYYLSLIYMMTGLGQ